MAVADDERFVTHAQHLPTSWGTLYDLTTLSADQFAEALGAGIIHPPNLGHARESDRQVPEMEES
jgi:hypothetical protein